MPKGRLAWRRRQDLRLLHQYSSYHGLIYSGEGIQRDRALCDNFLKLCMLLGMDITFLKTTAHKLGETSCGRYAKKIQDGRHWKLKRPYLGSYQPYNLVADTPLRILVLFEHLEKLFLAL